MKHSKSPWIVNPDYSKKNVYQLWDKNSNCHNNISSKVMDANAYLMESAPELLKQLVLAHRILLKTQWLDEGEVMGDIINAINLATKGA